MATKNELTQEPILIRQGSKIRLPYTYDNLVKTARGTTVEYEMSLLKQEIEELKSLINNELISSRQIALQILGEEE